tara:strand:+ start:17733 stop:18140 length:408 start_codon:yes stop_codon:yes gene_type:complete
MVNSFMQEQFGGVLNLALNGSTYDSSSPYLFNSANAWDYKRVIQVTPSNADAYIKLPDARDIPTGGPIWYMQNLHADTYNVWFKNNGGTNLAKMTPVNNDTTNQIVVLLLDNSTANGVWVFLGQDDSGLNILASS